jgi:nucleosome binding factor SPN SPT16 subunit
MTTINSQVQSGQHGIGTVIEINGSKAIVDFNGTKKEMLIAFLKPVKTAKVKSYMKEEVNALPSFNEVVNRIKGDAQMRGSMFNNSELFTSIEKLADSQNHFVGSIIEDARNGKFISEKQAYVVAFFAQKNNLIK